MSKRFLTGGVAALMMAGVCMSAADGSGGDGVSRVDKIKAALTQLDTTKDGDWTAAGLPDMERMKALTGLDDLKRSDVGEAVPAFNRANADSAPSDLKNAGGGDKTELEKAEERTKPNMPPEENPNVGRTDLSSAEGQVHTADQSDLLAASVQSEEQRRMPDASEIAAGLKDPILLIEAAMVAMNADDRYRRNSELQSFMRHYSVAQVNIRAHQARLDERQASRQANRAS